MAESMMSLFSTYLATLVENATVQIVQHPVHVSIEVFFGFLIVYFVYFVPIHKAKNTSAEPPTQKEEEELLDEFHSQPFETNPEGHSNVFDDPLQVVGYDGCYLTIDLPAQGARRALNLSSFDYFGFSTEPRVVEAAKATVRAYGVGSCGPRGFYGTMKPHLDLEANLARFLGTDSAIIYAMGIATTSTLIPGFAARGDTLFCDDAVQISVQGGCALSRSQVVRYRHNDVDHLEKLLQEFLAGEKRKGRKLFRRFIVTEGLFRNRGDLCRLPELVKLCAKYKSRIIIDDSYGFGALGATGRGTPEFFGIPMSEIDIYVSSLSAALGSVGGFCAGSNMVVDHQRLASTGYVFSASMPPFCSVAASTVIDLLEKDCSCCRALQSNAKLFRSLMTEKKLPPSIALIPCVGDISPICHFVCRQSEGRRSLDMVEEKKFKKCSDVLLLQHGIAASHSAYNEEEINYFAPSLRVVLKGQMSKRDVETTADIIVSCLRDEFQKE